MCEFLCELVEAISNWPEVVAIAEGGSQVRAIKIKPPISTLYLRPFRGAFRSARRSLILDRMMQN